MNKKMMQSMIRTARRAARQAVKNFAMGNGTWEELHLIESQLRDLVSEYTGKSEWEMATEYIEGLKL